MIFLILKLEDIEEILNFFTTLHRLVSAQNYMI